jgi:hypothetical protein
MGVPPMSIRGILPLQCHGQGVPNAVFCVGELQDARGTHGRSRPCYYDASRRHYKRTEPRNRKRLILRGSAPDPPGIFRFRPIA